MRLKGAGLLVELQKIVQYFTMAKGYTHKHKVKETVKGE